MHTDADTTRLDRAQLAALFGDRQLRTQIGDDAYARLIASVEAFIGPLETQIARMEALIARAERGERIFDESNLALIPRRA
jgi:hypothetical protein